MKEKSAKLKKNDTGRVKMKVLSIGNSFSEDAHAYLHILAEQRGIDLTTVDLAIGGCSLQRHWNNVEGNIEDYLHNINGQNRAERSVTVDEIIRSDTFDVVTLQQVSHFSGKYETYHPYIDSLVAYVKKHQPNAELYFHRTWAYELDSPHSEYHLYDKDQKKMYNDICEVTERVSREIGAKLIPAGDVIQAMRERVSAFDYANGGMTLCLEDGFHMSHTYGRFAVALTWLSTLTGKRAEPLPFKELDMALIKEICQIVNEIVFEKQI